MRKVVLGLLVLGLVGLVLYVQHQQAQARRFDTGILQLCENIYTRAQAAMTERAKIGEVYRYMAEDAKPGIEQLAAYQPRLQFQRVQAERLYTLCVNGPKAYKEDPLSASSQDTLVQLMQAVGDIAECIKTGRVNSSDVW